MGARSYLDQLQQKPRGPDRIVVIGAGFIGVEASDELNKPGKDVTLVEILPNIVYSCSQHNKTHLNVNSNLSVSPLFFTLNE